MLAVQAYHTPQRYDRYKWNTDWGN